MASKAGARVEGRADEAAAVPGREEPVAIGRAAGRRWRGESEPGGRGLSLLAGCIHSDRQALCSL
jgi:hypothetical protein